MAQKSKSKYKAVSKHLFSKGMFDHIKSNYDQLNVGLTDEEALYWYKLIMGSIGTRSEHKNDNEAVTLSMKAIHDKVGSDKYRYLTRRFFYVDDHDYQPSEYTMQWKLHPELEEIILRYDNNNKSDLMDANGRVVRTVPAGSVSKYDKNGNSKSSKLSFSNNYIRVNIDALSQLIEFVEDVIKEGDPSRYNEALNPKTAKTTEQLNGTLTYLKTLKGYCNNTLYPDEPGMIVTYQEGKSGRLFANELFNPQTMDSEIRKVVFGNMGYFDYDINNTNYVLIYSLFEYYKGIAKEQNVANREYAKANDKYCSEIKIPKDGFETVKTYIKNKAMMRIELADELNMSMATAKKILIALSMGAAVSKLPEYLRCSDVKAIYYKPTSKWKSQIFELLNFNPQAYDKVSQSELVRSMEAEIRIMTEFIVKMVKLTKYKHKNREFVRNLNNKVFCLSDKPTNKQIISHLIVGLESLIVESVIRYLPTDKSVVVIFDGFISAGRIENIREIIERVIDDIYTAHKIKVDFELSEDAMEHEFSRS